MAVRPTDRRPGDLLPRIETHLTAAVSHYLYARSVLPHGCLEARRELAGRIADAEELMAMMRQAASKTTAPRKTKLKR